MTEDANLRLILSLQNKDPGIVTFIPYSHGKLTKKLVGEELETSIAVWWVSGVSDPVCVSVFMSDPGLKGHTDHDCVSCC